MHNENGRWVSLVQIQMYLQEQNLLPSSLPSQCKDLGLPLAWLLIIRKVVQSNACGFRMIFVLNGSLMEPDKTGDKVLWF